MPKLWMRLEGNRDYPIMVQPGGIDSLGDLLKKRVKGRQACIISHPRIIRLYGDRIEKSLSAHKFKIEKFLVPEGETSKSIFQYEKIIGKMLEKKIDRQAFIIALGGGVVGDLAGLIAGTYMRGIDFIQVPTTLLAQIDSSIGGKVAINHSRGKNLIGMFYQPKLVVIDPRVLNTLARRQFCSGLAELIKSAIIFDDNFFRQLEKRIEQILVLDEKTLTWAVTRACKIKAQVVTKDEKELGLRAILNYGHTFGHALESYHEYRGYLHGEAVALGMVIAANLSYILGLSSRTTLNRQREILQKVGLPIKGKKEQVKRILNIMENDKKVSQGKIKIILTPQIGHAKTVKQTPYSLVCQALKAVLG